MTPAEIEAALQEAFAACSAAACPLDAQQQELLFRVLIDRLATAANVQSALVPPTAAATRANPLDPLTAEQRQALLQFVQAQQRENLSWKAQLLNDWLQNRSSGAMQFIREDYGLQWLQQVQPEDIAEYADETPMALKLGDRIEVSNGLWEWVQDDGPCTREWFPCTVINLTVVSDTASLSATGYSHQTNGVIRFENGMEYEIQGICEWNRYNWRWRG